MNKDEVIREAVKNIIGNMSPRTKIMLIKEHLKELNELAESDPNLEETAKVMPPDEYLLIVFATRRVEEQTTQIKDIEVPHQSCHQKDRKTCKDCRFRPLCSILVSLQF